MYRRSHDLRFVKNKEALQRAFIDLTLERGLDGITVKDLTDRARVNRMTFYSHYDDLSDLVREFTDDMIEEILEDAESDDGFDAGVLLEKATVLMEREIDFFRLVAQDERYAFCRNEFRKAFKTLLTRELEKSSDLRAEELRLRADMLASGITYAYLDWLAGAYEDLPLDAIVGAFETLLAKAVNF